MNSSVQIGRVFGVPLRMHWSAPLLVILLGYVLGSQGLPLWFPGEPTAVYAAGGAAGAVLLMASLLAHEAAHAVTALRKGVAVEDVTIWALGGMTRMGKPQTAAVALLVAINGPLTSVAVGAAAMGAGFGLYAATGWAVAAAVVVWVGWANLLLAVFNLLPAAPLDGGRVVQALTWWRTGDREQGERAAGRSGQVMGALLIAGGWFWAFNGALSGLWLALIGLFMVVVASAEWQRARLSTALRGIRVADAMSSPVATGPDWLTVDHFIDSVAAQTRHSALPLLDIEGRPSGIVELPQLARVPDPQRENVRVREVATPLSRCTTAAPDDLLLDILEDARPGAGTWILVMDGERLVGFITAHDLNRLLEQRKLGGPTP
ncbi:site-2 protease family protein [Streptomyces gobiensis]|uniref:site-2 protease family protein n=1 Tax=Streptomyces gobiensis TaxID=2875706 RepID=UPI001E337285|nr:site-2 protease family protein [Streptomyces gobiensis]UGY93181.1 site-2 protease family protein [Streptomyces gobiensis]